MSIFISPHCDDETLFGAFTLLRGRPLVVVIFDGHVQASRGLQVTADERREETRRACRILGVGVTFLGLSDADPNVDAGAIRDALLARLGRFNETVYAPAFEPDGHVQHNAVADAIDAGPRVTRYLTYTGAGKSTDGRKVPIERPEWIAQKLEALACYKSQFNLDARMGCWPHFLRSQEEYYAL